MNNVDDVIGIVEALLLHNAVTDDDHTCEQLGECLRLLKAHRSGVEQPEKPSTFERIATALEAMAWCAERDDNRKATS